MVLALFNLKVSAKSKAFTVYSVLHTQMYTWVTIEIRPNDKPNPSNANVSTNTTG